ncbi:MAG: hypothetical protein R3B95_11480 [Nitrospirales bacterium]|nr:hypothetical protein [Nitrospirales bacterium]
MKTFKIIGPDTMRAFDVGEDEVLVWSVMKTKVIKDIKAGTVCREIIELKEMSC